MFFILAEFGKFMSSILTRAWRNGSKLTRTLIIVTFISALVVMLAASIGFLYYPQEEKTTITFASIVIVIFIIIITILFTYVENLERETNEEIISRKEKEIAEHPDKPKLSWDLARIKLEKYIDRNLVQIKSIFYLCISVMFVGFCLIIYSAVMVFEDTQNLKPAIIVSISGIITNFIAASFLVIYKSIMEQSKEYVIVLERINAVGMSIQIIDTIKDDNGDLKDETKAELAKKLIDLYSKK